MNNSLTRSIIVSLFFCLLIWAGFQIPLGSWSSGSQLKTLQSDFLEAKRLFESKSFLEANKILTSISKSYSGSSSSNPLVSLSNLYLAKTLELLGDNAEAEKFYRSIPDDRAISLDAKLGLERLLALKDPSLVSASKGVSINSLQSVIKQFYRHDLQAELDLLRAIYSEKKSPNVSMGIYEKLRLGSNTLAGRKAQQRIEYLRTRFPQVFSLDTTPELINEIIAARSQREFKRAEELLEQAKQKAGPESDASGEIIYQQALLLKAQGRNDEYLNLLLRVAAGEVTTLSDKALLELAKLKWNANKSEQALSYLKTFSMRFKRSLLLDEARYIEARIYEEQKLLAKSEKIYRELASAGSEKFSSRSLKRLAWNYLISGNTTEAKESFQALIKKYKGRKESTSNDYRHALYWLAMLGDGGMQDKEILKGLCRTYHFDYYGMRACKQLNKAPPLLDSLASQSAGDNQSSSCSETLSIRDDLSSLKNNQLRKFLKHELNYFFVRSTKNLGLSRIYSKDPLSQQELGSFVAYLNLLNSNLHTDLLPRLASQKLVANVLGGPQLSPACLDKLFKTSFPVKYSNHFEEVKSTPTELLLALIRTESHFYPMSVSPVGARGLMQLMPATARAQGYDGPLEGLFEPELNILLGQTVLKKLLEKEKTTVLALAAYNAGTKQLAVWKERFAGLDESQFIEMISYPETNAYVKKVLTSKDIYQKILETSVKG